MAQLVCRDLAVGYDGKAVARDVSFRVDAGDYLCILGENGAGKSTLMKTILGLQPPLGGEIETGDGLRPNEIGYLPQQTAAQKDFPASGREVVLSGCQGRCGKRVFYNADEKRIAEDAMARMHVDDLAPRCYRELSGGQQQRVLLARALCAARKMLLLDEPVSGLDPVAAADMYRLIDRLNRDDGMSIIMISHDMHAAMSHANRVLHIGGKPFFGTVQEYLKTADGARFARTEGGDAV